MKNQQFIGIINMHDLDKKVLVKQAIQQLDPRLQFVAIRRFYHNQTLSSIAEELGISAARAFQLERKLLYTLRAGFIKGRM